jgi:type II secretory pathway component PulC
MISFDEIVKKYQQDSLLGACLLLGFLILITFIYTLTQWYSDLTILSRLHQTPPTLMETGNTNNLITAIPREHLFGHPIPTELPITSMGINLLGIIKLNTDREDDTSSALISLSGEPAKTYHAGESLPNGVKIEAIEANAVILKNNEQLEKLPLQRIPLEFKPKAQRLDTVVQKDEPRVDSVDSDEDN